MKVSDAIILVVGVLLTIAVCIFGINIYKMVTGQSNNIQAQLNDMNNELSQQKYSIYDNTSLQGAQVINAVRKYSNADQFGIEIITGKDPAGKWYGKTVDLLTGVVGAAGSGVAANLEDESDVQYINISATFTSKLVYDANNVVRAIVFTQK